MENSIVKYERTERLRPINDGQRELFKQITEAANNGHTLYRENLRIIYQAYVQQSQYKYEDYFDHDQKKWKTHKVPVTEDYIDILFESWLLRALGALVKKGYLDVLPRINLKKIETESIKVIDA